MDNYYKPGSPQSMEVFSDVEMRDRGLLNKAVINNRFKDGYAPVENSKPAFRGRKTFAFWTLLTLLFILVIGNLLLTLTIIGVLRLGQGVQNIELVPEENTIKLSGDVDLDHIYKRDGIIEGFQNKPVEITSNDNSILLNLAKNGRSNTKVKIDPLEIAFKGILNFDINDKFNRSIFTATEPVYDTLRNVGHLKTKHIQTNRIRSQTDANLKVDADMINFKGAEGTEIHSKEFIWNADQDIYLKSINGSVVLAGTDGVFIDVTRIPIAKLSSSNYVTSQFKVCVCMPEGKLFRIPIANPNENVYCHHVGVLNNPCGKYY